LQNPHREHVGWNEKGIYAGVVRRTKSGSDQPTGLHRIAIASQVQRVIRRGCVSTEGIRFGALSALLLTADLLTTDLPTVGGSANGGAQAGAVVGEFG